MATDKKDKAKKKDGSPKKRRKHFGAWIIALVALACATIAGLFYWYQIEHYEDNLVEIYAEQQDAYVQLVLDQINLVDERDTEEIVNDILGTISGSPSEFWVLSENDALVYVKDVAETNRYRGFSDATYYDTESAQEFVSSLEVNKVQHSIIQMNDRRFIASGVAFSYNGATYRLCLLTSEHVVIDHNAYLSARVNLTITVGIILLMLVIGALVVGLRGDKWMKRAHELEDENAQLYATIAALNDKLMHEDFYDTRLSVFNSEAAGLFYEKLKAHGSWPTTFVVLQFTDQQAKERYLTIAQAMFDDRVVKFDFTRSTLLVVLVGCDRHAALTTVSVPLDNDSSILGYREVVASPEESWEEFCLKLGREGDSGVDR